MEQITLSSLKKNQARFAVISIGCYISFNMHARSASLMASNEITIGSSLLNDQIIFNYAEELGYGKFHIKIDSETGLRAIIAIHSTKRGPALGGCRLLKYPHIGAAFNDAMRLGYGMSYKAAISDLPLGGGKAVLLKPDEIQDRTAYFKAFGKFVESLKGEYITAVDSGTSVTDMETIASQTNYVTGTSSEGGDPSPLTALGVRRGIEAAVKFKLNKDNLKGIHVAIQGLGRVGYYLCKELIPLGAKITASDIDKTLVEKYENELPIETVLPENIYDVESDVFSPCALGGTLNERTIPRLKATIIAGSANNQLERPQQGEMLHLKNILYTPDYAINAGGLIFAYAQYTHASLEKAQENVSNIYYSLMNIFERSKVENSPTSWVADEIAKERLEE